MPLLENSLLFFCFFSLPSRSHKGLPFMHQIDENFHTPSKKHWRNWGHHIKVVTWMCFTLVGCGRGLLIHFAPNSTLFSPTQGCCASGHPCLFAEINLFPWKSQPNTFFFWQHRSVSFTSGMAMLKRPALKIVSIFSLFRWPGDISTEKRIRKTES